LTIRDGLYLFISTGVNAYTLQRDMYLLHCGEFYMHWVGEGVNMNGCVLHGHVMEDDFLNKYDEEDEEGDREEDEEEDGEEDEESDEPEVCSECDAHAFERG